MAPAPREHWLELAAEVGLLVAPAGLNFAVGSTTWWLYTCDVAGLASLTPPAWPLRPTGLRVPFRAEGLRRELSRLEPLDVRWQAVLADARGRLPPVSVERSLRGRLEEVARELPEFALQAFVVRSAALLEATRLVPEYHPPDREGPGYLFDLLENGLTLLQVGRAGAPTRSTRRRGVSAAQRGQR